MKFINWFNDFEFSGVLDSLKTFKQGRDIWLTGVWGASRAFVSALWLCNLKQPAVLVFENEDIALKVYEELRFFMQGFSFDNDKKNISAFEVKYPSVFDPGQDPLVYFPAVYLESCDSVNREHGRTIERLLILRRLALGQPLIMVTTVQALAQKLMPPEMLVGHEIFLEKEKQYSRSVLISQLEAAGYERQNQVENPGHFSVRGGIVDIAPANTDLPLRLEFDSDILTSLRFYDPLTQRSLEKIDSFSLMPFQEMLPYAEVMEAGMNRIRDCGIDKKNLETWLDKLEENPRYFHQDWLIPFFYPETGLFDYLECLPVKPLLIWDQPLRIEGELEKLKQLHSKIYELRLERGLLAPTDGQYYFSWHQIKKKTAKIPCVFLSLLKHTLNNWREPEIFELSFKEPDLALGEIEHLATRLKIWREEGLKVLICCHSVGFSKRISQLLAEKGVTTTRFDSAQRPLVPAVTEGHLEKGFIDKVSGWVIISESDILKKETLKVPRVYRHRYRGLKSSAKAESFSELEPGQMAVHEEHGIGIFKGMVKLTIEGFQREFICLEYADKDKLYVPAEQAELVQKYLGGEENPRLHKLGSLSWANTRARVKKQVEELAKELLETEAKRKVLKGFSCGADTSWQNNFEESFPYEETIDQLKAIEEVKLDLQSFEPMDRLVCGDVGYGKTEVALRAAFKTVDSGRQVAVLVPTTVLAQQHYLSFKERMAEYPVKVELLSRFRSARECRLVVEGLKSGQVDLVVGTHRLLSKDISFSGLGLIIVDEEQRFGVAHKERLKQLKAQVDIMTLSATPIPRTLHLALSGLKEMSLIETPPLARLPILTFVVEEDKTIIREAVLRELERQGQVFFVHNRVRSIERTAQMLRELVPEARFAVAHGQMAKHELEEVMVKFLGRALDVLVTTTIIESGLDMPNVNTILIDQAQDFGLSQLYQLRGRVGRSQRQAWAYLFYPRGKVIPEIAEKRLRAMEEFTELGSGFKVAMRDLEIRGVGNILGPQQHGNVASVGYDLYCHLLSQAVAQCKGETVSEEIHTKLDLDLEAYIPDSYIVDSRTKMEIYKKLSNLDQVEKLVDLKDEILDRFGSFPAPLKSLLEAVEIRIMAKSQGIIEIVQKATELVARWHSSVQPEKNFFDKMLANFGSKISFLAGPPFGVKWSLDTSPTPGKIKTILFQTAKYVKIKT
jgi:transcription-repair coupling factor (superfamily II helicase)